MQRIWRRGVYTPISYVVIAFSYFSLIYFIVSFAMQTPYYAAIIFWVYLPIHLIYHMILISGLDEGLDMTDVFWTWHKNPWLRHIFFTNFVFLKFKLTKKMTEKVNIFSKKFPIIPFLLALLSCGSLLLWVHLSGNLNQLLSASIYWVMLHLLLAFRFEIIPILIVFIVFLPFWLICIIILRLVIQTQKSNSSNFSRFFTRQNTDMSQLSLNSKDDQLRERKLAKMLKPFKATFKSLEFNQKMCCIWLSDFENKEIIAKLKWDPNHIFHFACFREWIDSSDHRCPYWRKTIAGYHK